MFCVGVAKIVLEFAEVNNCYLHDELDGGLGFLIKQ